ncbi:MAG: DJ-1/PfpI/YhbO family deglycase/protease [Clostridia bacterium]
MKRALIIAGKGTQDQEFIYPYYRLQEAGYRVDVAVNNKDEVTTFNGIKIVPTIGTYYLNPEGWDLLILPGGAKALEYIRQNLDVIRAVKEFYDAGKIIAAICHGSQLLISAKIIKGKKISGYYSIKDDIENAGATYVDANVVVDGNIITSPHYKYLGDWMKATLEQIENPSITRVIRDV